jgi:hypothetical protein
MPLHTPGIDCNGVSLLGRWITSVPASLNATLDDVTRALDAAERFDSGCLPPARVTWLDEDFSDPPIYAPRRGDWNDPVNGMPASIRALQLTDRLRQMADVPVPDGYWFNPKINGVEQCAFPIKDPPAEPAPWMFVDNDPSNPAKRPWGELRSEKPGEYFFNSVCFKCHGAHANADSALAKTILSLTGGNVRVANLHDGLFGNAGANTALFDVVEPGSAAPRNLAANYLVWMASGGTKVQFPRVLSDIVGENGGNMLFLVRNNYCANLLPGAAAAYQSYYQNYDVVFRACAFDNPITPELGFQADGRTPLHPALQAAWLDRAVQNVGFAIFRYLLKVVDGSAGPGDHWPVNDCRELFPAH